MFLPRGGCKHPVIASEKTPPRVSPRAAALSSGNVIDVSEERLLVQETRTYGKIDALLRLLSGYEILELARTGVAGLGRGTKNIIMINPDGQTYRYADGEPED